MNTYEDNDILLTLLTSSALYSVGPVALHVKLTKTKGTDDFVRVALLSHGKVRLLRL